MTSIKIRTRDDLPLLRADLSKVDPSLRSGLEQCLDQANALLRANYMARAGRTWDARTRDEINESMNTGKVIELGTRWDGEAVNAKLDEKLDVVRPFVRGFTAGHIVHAEDPDTMISLGKIFTPHVQDDEQRERLTRATDELEAEWKKDKRSEDAQRAAKDAEAATPGLVEPERLGRTFGPGTQRSEAEAFWNRSDGPLMAGVQPPDDGRRTKVKVGDWRARTNPGHYQLLGSNAGITTTDYAKNLTEGRKAMAESGADMTPAADYDAKLKAERAKMSGR